MSEDSYLKGSGVLVAASPSAPLLTAEKSAASAELERYPLWKQAMYVSTHHTPHTAHRTHTHTACAARTIVRLTGSWFLVAFVIRFGLGYIAAGLSNLLMNFYQLPFLLEVAQIRAAYVLQTSLHNYSSSSSYLFLARESVRITDKSHSTTTITNVIM